jgi:hypothetical protein
VLIAPAGTFQNRLRNSPGRLHAWTTGTPPGPAERRHEVPTWFWLNIPIGAVLFVAMVGIPLWLVFKRADTGPDVAEAAVIPVYAAAMTEAVGWRDAA